MKRSLRFRLWVASIPDWVWVVLMACIAIAGLWYLVYFVAVVQSYYPE